MSTASRNWITPGHPAAVISTGRTTGIKQVTMDTIDTVGEFITTARGHKFNPDTLESPGDLANMYDWRIANPEAAETRHDIAVQNRDKALNVVRKYQDAMEADPHNRETVSLVVQSLNRYRDTIIEAEASARLMQVGK